MNMGLNYSNQAGALVRARRIPIDVFKCPNDLPDLIPAARLVSPIYVHFALAIGSGRFAQSPQDWEMIATLRAETQTRYVNLHLEPRVADFPSMSMSPVGPQRIRVLDAILRDLEEVVRHVDPGSIIVENVPLPRGGWTSPADRC